MKKDNDKTEEGIIRQCTDKTNIYEVQCVNWSWKGYARSIY
jgi:hypothetical protein